MLTQQEVTSRLKTVVDPELGIDIVALGLIYEINIDPSPYQKHGRVHVHYTLTTPVCPLAETIVKNISVAFSDLTGFDPLRDLQLELSFEIPWTLERMSEEARAELGF